MKIIADQAIAGVEALFGPLGELVLLPGRRIDAEHVRDADVLLVRTVTRVNETLLGHSSVCFVGSAASGTDHVDQAWLLQQGIGFAHAPGCNADAVVNYVFAALAWLEQHRNLSWQHRTVGILGAGNVGSRLAKAMLELGMQVGIHDPFLDQEHPLSAHFVSRQTVFASDLVSLHVPLTRDGPHPTWHVLGRKQLAELPADGVLINAARGEVVDNRALLDTLNVRDDLTVVLDVWENEPAIDPALLQRVAIGTPHIAGYSRNGKTNATRAVFRAFCDYFDIPQHSEEGGTIAVEIQPGSLETAILQAYGIQNDFLDSGLKATDLATEFERRRNGYHFREEFNDYCFKPAGLPAEIARRIRVLGFAEC